MNTITIRLNEPEILKIYGRSALVYLKKMNYWVSMAENSKKPIGIFKDGRRWLYNTVDEWANQIGYSSRQTQRSITALVKDKVILVQKVKRHRRPSINSYALNFQKLQEIGLAMFPQATFAPAEPTIRNLKGTSPEYSKGEGALISGSEPKEKASLNTTVQNMTTIWNTKFPNNQAILNIKNGRFLNAAYQNSFDHRLDKWETYCNILTAHYPQGIFIEEALQFKMINRHKNTQNKIIEQIIQGQSSQNQPLQKDVKPELSNQRSITELDISKSQEMLDIWNKTFENKSTYTMTPDRQIFLAQALKENFNTNIEEWKCHCLSIQSSPWIMGSEFKLHLTWAVKKEAIERVKAKELGVKETFAPKIKHTHIVEAHIAELALIEDPFLTQVRRVFIKMYGEGSYRAWIMKVDLRIENRQLILVSNSVFMREHPKSEFPKIFDYVSQYAPSHLSLEVHEDDYEYSLIDLSESDVNNYGQELNDTLYDSDDKYGPEYEYNSEYGYGYNKSQSIANREEGTSQSTFEQISEIEEKSLNDIHLNEQFSIINSTSQSLQNGEEDIGHSSSKDVREGGGSYRHDVSPHITLIHNQHNNNQIKALEPTNDEVDFTNPLDESNQQVRNYYLKNIYWKKEIHKHTLKNKLTSRTLGLSREEANLIRKSSYKKPIHVGMERKQHLNASLEDKNNFEICDRVTLMELSANVPKMNPRLIAYRQKNTNSLLMISSPFNSSSPFTGLVLTENIHDLTAIKRAGDKDMHRVGRQLFFRTRHDNPKRGGEFFQKWLYQQTTLVLYDFPHLTEEIKKICRRCYQSFLLSERGDNLIKILMESLGKADVVMKKNLWLLGIIVGLGIASTDIFVSELPNLSDFYRVTPEMMSLTISVFFISCMFGSFSFIFFSKFYTHKFINIFSLLGFAIGSVIITLGEVYWFIFFGRILQGIAYGIANTNIISSIKKNKNGDFSKSMTSYCMANEFVCLFAPMTGIFLAEYLDWRSPFLLVSIITFLLIKKSSDVIYSFDSCEIDKSRKIVFSKYDINFWLNNFISIIMIGTGWSMIALSPYILESDNGSVWGHGLFYTFYSIFYMLGGYLFDKNIINKNNIIKTSTIVLILFSFSMLYVSYEGGKLMFSFGMLLFGGVSGVLYGPIMGRTMENVAEVHNNTATAITVISRQISSGLFVAISSWLYVFDQKYSLIFGTVMGLCAITLLSIGGRDRIKQTYNCMKEIS